MTSIPEPWPLRHLVLRTPRLELRPDDDEGLLQLVERAQEGVHPPEQQPFLVAWTDEPPAVRGTNTMRFHWNQRANLSAEHWTVNFLVRLHGTVVGTQSLGAKDFAITREVSSGSWLGRRFQGQGIGTEMRAAVLMFAFDHLAAEQARSGAFSDNAQSLRVSEKLGYRPDGTERRVVRGQAVTEHRLLLTSERFADFRPAWELRVAGAEGVLGVLGAKGPDQPRN